MNILSLCTVNIQRSRTAAEVFSAIDKSNNYKFAGLSKKYVDKAGTNLCSEDLLDWADKNYVFEGLHIEIITRYIDKKHIVPSTR